MNSRMRRLAPALAILIPFAGSVAIHADPGDRLSPERVWERLDRTPPDLRHREPRIAPRAFRLFRLDRAALFAVLGRAPRSLTAGPPGADAVLELPMPDGTFARFRIVESPVMAPDLASKFPGIGTYAGLGLDDPYATIRLDWTRHGFHAQVLSPRGSVYVDPYWRGDDEHYVSYFRRDYVKAGDAEPFRCHARHGAGPSPAPTPLAAGAAAGPGPSPLQSGGTLLTYRLAVATTGEYTIFHSQPAPANVADGLSAVVTSVNRITGIYETEFAIRLELVPGNDLLIYTDPASDPYTNADVGRMAQENHQNLRRVLGADAYDVGHVYGVGGGGLAWYGVVCWNGGKGGGASGIPNPIGDPFDVSYVAHEIGHQFRADHTFNGLNCGTGQWWGPTAMEPGSGSTIMSYAGICGADNLQPDSDPYFHSINYDQIREFVTTGSGADCAVAGATGNGAPIVSAGPDFVIPRETPFVLTASGSDSDGDPLTWSWEERDLGPQVTLASPDNGESPLFRVYDPMASPSRTFPALIDLLNNIPKNEERLPVLPRTMDFRVTARDARPLGGGVGWDEMQVAVTDAAGPFRVTHPNGPANLYGSLNVTWDVAGTDLPPVSAASVDILLSTDGGLSWPHVLAAGTPNDGSETILLPLVYSTAARVRVQGSGHIFFDVSNANFTLLAPPGEVSRPGAVGPFIIEPLGTGYTLRWSAPADGAPADRYLLYSYPLGALPGSPACEADLGVGTSIVLPFLPAGRAFVVVGRNVVGEGSYGRTSGGAERPRASGAGLCP